ncbi:uncharacterized protein [Prorops nasuta]|uniref:uncharacterized protein n=1 Tax=Prorops nasuta TaxID=863751 RepID=UPI0034CF397E
MPPTYILNKLDVRQVLEEIEFLNDYERLLIQRAKAFQTDVKMGTVANKKLPFKHMVSKVKGRTFHLPLPTEETLKKICPSKNPINLNHELYIMVREIPTKSKVVWENLVDIKKVWNALLWLKDNNPIYKEIILPESPRKLLSTPDLQDTEFQIKSDNYNPDNLDDSDEFPDKNNENKNQNPALLTQMLQSDSYYEQFTIYPMYEKRNNETSTTLYQMLKVQDCPLDSRSHDLDVKCFPDLYPYGINGQHENRSVRLTNFEFIKSRLMSKHPQFRLNIQYLFYLLHDNNMRQLNAGIFHKMNVTNPREKYTAATYLEKLNKEQLETNLNTIFARLRNTAQYWSIPRNMLRCMIFHYGPATWFLTPSPSEWLWTDMIEYLRHVNNPRAEKMSANELIASDPVSVSRFIKNKFNAMIKFITSSDKPIGEVTHYFIRREYQGRDTQHIHCLIWIKDAPIIGKSKNQEVSAFILKYITCRLPLKTVSPELYSRVNTHQRHTHNNYCLRYKKNKSSHNKVCRFGFSRPVINSLKMRDVAISISSRKKLNSKKRLYDLPRSGKEININDYNPAILTAWEGNMDIQFVGEKSTLLTCLRSNLWNIGMRMLNHRECGALEAADSLLGIPLYFTDPNTTIKWLDVNIIRSKKLKTRKEIESLDDDSTEIFCPSLIDNYYTIRPKQLESMCLYDFAQWYDIIKYEPKRDTAEYYPIGKSLFVKRRSRPALINHFNYNVHTQLEKYYYALLLLFKHWRDISELKNRRDTYAEAFLSLQSKLTKALEYHERIEDIQKCSDHIKQLVAQQIEKDDKKEEACESNEIECVPVEAICAMKDFQDVENKQNESINITQMVSELNADQKRVFDKVTEALTSKNNILRLYVSGEGGTGKSFLIKTIRCWTKQVLGKDTAVTVPTGIAAFNIDGLTIHRLFQLPVEHGHTAKYSDLSDQVLKIVRNELKNVTFIIIDEVSMISNIIFMYIHLRLTAIFNTEDCEDGWFGNKHILLFGDLLQLPPVHEDPAFIKLSNDKILNHIGAIGTADLWAALFTYDELRINMRQKGDLSYKDVLSRIRVGIVLGNDTAILASRMIKLNDSDYNIRIYELCDYISQLPTDTVCLFATCEKCDFLNTTMLKNISSEEIKLIAKDSVDCPSYLREKTEQD